MRFPLVLAVIDGAQATIYDTINIENIRDIRGGGMAVTIIAAVANNGIIGQGQRLPWHLPADLRHFRRTTWGHPIVMGRRTFESIGHSLPGRWNLVVSRTLTAVIDGIDIVSSLEEALQRVQTAPEVFVIGGASLYTQVFPHANRLHLTRIQADFEGDTYFPDFYPADWRETSREEHTSPFPFSFTVLDKLI